MLVLGKSVASVKLHVVTNVIKCELWFPVRGD